MAKVQDGLEKARETAAKIKAESKKEKSLANSGISTDALAFLKTRAKENRGIDANEGGSLPMLTLIQNSEFSGEMADGSEPIPGAYYYKPKRVQLQKPIVNIIYVKECRLDTEYQGEVKKNKAHYLIAGIIEGTNDPFVMYIKGLSYGEVVIEETSLMIQTRPWRKHPQNPVPMYAFRIQLDSVYKTSDWGKKRATIYKMLTDDNGIPQIVTDQERLEMLDAAVDNGQNMVEGIIERNHQGKFEDTIDEVLNKVEPEEQVENGEVEASDDIPF